MKAINIIIELREKYCKKYRMAPDNHKAHYIRWLQDEYAELVMKQTNGVQSKKATAILPHINDTVCEHSWVKDPAINTRIICRKCGEYR